MRGEVPRKIRPRPRRSTANGLSTRWDFRKVGKFFTPAAIAASQQENYATIANYLAGELRYMDAGE
jgi:hypothetical protein